jgi:hypothetical protein
MLTSVFGVYYVMLSSFGEFFSKTYGFSFGIGGLTYLGLGVGFFFSTVFNAKFADNIYHHVGIVYFIGWLSVQLIFTIQKLARKNGGVGKPEMRMPAVLIGSLFIPVGVL